MSTKIARFSLAASLVAACLLAAGAAAQETPAAERAAVEAQTERMREQAERMRIQAETLAHEQARLAEQQAEQAERMSELERARAELEAAAREVARLAAERTEPVAGAFLRQRFAPGLPRATLGLVVENAGERVRVLNVTPNGPAQEAGIVSGDVIVAIDGTALGEIEAASPSEALVEHVADLDPGTPVRVRLAGDAGAREVVLTTRSAGSAFFTRLQESDAGGLFGDGARVVAGPLAEWSAGIPAFDVLRRFNAWQSMQLVALTPDLGRYFGTDEGMLVVRAPERDGLGLRDGDVILEIGERVPSSPEHATRILASYEPGETLRIRLMRDQARETLEIAVPEAPR